MQSANEMVVEQRPALKTFQESAAAPIKSILFVVHDDDGLEARLQAALSLARACSAHLKLLQVIPTASYTIVDPLGANFASAAIVEALEVQAAEVRNRLELHLSKEDASWNYEVTTAPTLSELVQNAALADLVVMGRQPKWHEFSRTGPGLLGAMLCNTRTPLCIPGDGRQNFDPFGTAVIAWNGSVEAANAVRASIGMLRMSSQVRVVRFTEDKEVGFPTPDWSNFSRGTEFLPNSIFGRCRTISPMISWTMLAFIERNMSSWEATAIAVPASSCSAG